MLDAGDMENEFGRFVARVVGTVAEANLSLDHGPSAALDERADGFERACVG
jgi:hypothetical protein